MISFAKVTKATYDALTPVQDRLYYIEDTGEQFLNGKPYNGNDGTRDWLCFTAHNDNATIRLDKVGAPWDIALETSTDGINWTAYTWDGTTGATITLANQNDKVYWRGDNDTFTQSSNNRYQYVMTGTIRASGNIMSLLSKDCSLKEFAQNDQRFQYLFGDCASLISAPKLPATKLGYHTYNHLFYNCTRLTEVPELPATSFLGSCYANMFDGCTVLRTVPPLPYTGDIACCWGMYANCTNIKSVEIPEYMFMGADHLKTAFQGCTSLKYVKVGFHSFDSATTDWLDGVSATGTFICPSDLVISSRGASTVPSGWKITRDDAVQGDWSESDSSDPAYIQNKPTIPDAQVQSDWDESDSSDVTFIQNKPTLATVATSGSYNDLTDRPSVDYLCFSQVNTNYNISFKLNKVGSPDAIDLEWSYDKENWTTYTWEGNTGYAIPILLNTTTHIYLRGNNDHFSKDNSNYYAFDYSPNDDFQSRFTGNIMTLLDKTAVQTTVPSYAFYKLFSSTTSGLFGAPDLPAIILSSHCYDSMFQSCGKLVAAPDLPATVLAEYCYSEMFSGCRKMIKAPKMSATTLADFCCNKMFYNCAGLVNAPELPATTMASNCYNQMFYNCTGLVNAPELPATTVEGRCYYRMFQGCTSLVSAPKILPATNLVNSCYQEMFYGCSALTNAPELPATTVPGYSYISMFRDCASLAIAPKFAGTSFEYNSFSGMLRGCSNLKYVKVVFTTWNSSYSTNWLDGVSATGVFDCPSTLDTSTRGADTVPSGWAVTHGANEPDDGTTSAVEATTTDIYAVCPSSGETGVLTVASALTLNAMPNASTEIAYAEIVLDLAQGASVTAGSNITFVDTPTAGKRNVCVVRWADGAAKLYVTITEDLDASSSI